MIGEGEPVPSDLYMIIVFKVGTAHKPLRRKMVQEGVLVNGVEIMVVAERECVVHIHIRGVLRTGGDIEMGEPLRTVGRYINGG